LPWRLEKECRASLVQAYLLSPGPDPEEVRYGQLLTLLTTLWLLLTLHLVLTAAQVVL
jgi:hypothetical protein